MQLPAPIPLELAILVIEAVCIVGILWWLYRRYRKRRPAPKPSGEPK